MKKLILLVLVLAMVSSASAAIITGVDRTGGASDDRDPIGVYDGSTAPLATEAGGLADGNIVFSDRTYPWTGIPAIMIGSENIRTFNNDKNEDETVNYAVSINQTANLWIAIDDRHDGQQGLIDGVVADFAAAGAFADTGLDIFIREREDGTRDRPLSVFAAELAAGTYNFGGTPGNNFIVLGASADAIPEPATIALLGMGGMALLRRRRK